MADLQAREEHAGGISVLPMSDDSIPGQAIDRFSRVAEEAGYDIDALRMEFSKMAIRTLCREDLSPNEISRTIQAIRDTASLMGVDSSPISRKMKDQQDADLIINAINPKIEGLLEAIERGKHAEAFDGGAEAPATAYSEVQE